jgi:putative transposase
MDTAAPPNPYKHHRFPAEIISHSVWLYFRFCLSYRDVEELLFECGVIVTYEAIRQWCCKFVQHDATRLYRRHPRLGDKWHLDEVFLTIHGERHYLWRAVDQDGHVLDILVQRHRDKTAAKKFLRKLRKGLQYVPRVIITDKLASYGGCPVYRTINPQVCDRIGWFLLWDTTYLPPLDALEVEDIMNGSLPAGNRRICRHPPPPQHPR